MAESSLESKIRLKKARVTILGLGHIGLPTALLFARSGFAVTGADVDTQKVEMLERGECYVREPGLPEILRASLQSGAFRVTSDVYGPIPKSDVISVCVPTPVKNTKPDLECFEAAFDAVKAGAHKPMAVFFESTVPPSTMSKVVVPEIERLGYEIDKDVFLAYCPERLLPTRALEELVNNTRIVGGIGPKSGHIAAEFFRTVCKDVIVTDALTAELAKVAENTYRDLNIAYANLLALICERLGGDVNNVVRIANTHPRVAIHMPGLGVGGPCLPKDPYMLVNDAPAGPDELIRIARRINDDITKHAINLLKQTLKDNRSRIEDTKVAVLGVAYKPDTGSVINTPAKLVIEELLEMGASVYTYDPYCAETYGSEKALSQDDALRNADCVVFVTAHTEFRSIELGSMMRLVKPRCVIFDGPRLLDATEAEKLGFVYLGIGYGSYDKSRRAYPIDG